MSRDSIAKRIEKKNSDEEVTAGNDKIAIYARVSLDRQAESVEHQISLLREVIRTRMLGQLLDEFIYEDEGVSATKYSIWTRPAMKRLLNDAKAGKFNIVMFKGISRFARSTQEALDVLDRLKAKGLRVISYEENYDSEKENSNFMFTMHAAIAEYEAEKIGIRVRLGNKAKAQSGLWVGMAPDGYKLVERRLVVDETRKHIIETIFELYTAGAGGFKVAAHLNNKGWLTASGKLWCSKTVRDIICNEVYIGKIIYNKTRQHRIRDYESEESGKKKWVRNINSLEDWVIVENAHEPLIEADTYTKAQNIMNRRRFKKDAPNVHHPFTGILFCVKCGQGMVCQKRSTKTKIYRYYICKTYHKYGRGHCPQANINANYLEQQICELLEEKLKAINRTIIETRIAKKDFNFSRLEKQLGEIIRKIEKLNKDRADLYFERESMTQEQYAYISKRLKNEADRLTAKRQELEQDIKNDQEKENLIAEIKKYIDEFLMFDRRDLSRLRYLAHYFIERIEVSEMKIKVVYVFEL